MELNRIQEQQHYPRLQKSPNHELQISDEDESPLNSSYSTSSDLGSLDTKSEEDDTNYVLDQEKQSNTQVDLEQPKYRSHERRNRDDNDEHRQNVLLYVVKMGSHNFEHLKMKLDCTKCSGENDSDLRKFKRRVKRKLALVDGFRIFNYQGYPINEEEISFLNQENSKKAVVYVAANSCKAFLV